MTYKRPTLHGWTIEIDRTQTDHRCLSYARPNHTGAGLPRSHVSTLVSRLA